MWLVLYKPPRFLFSVAGARILLSVSAARPRAGGVPPAALRGPWLREADVTQLARSAAVANAPPGTQTAVRKLRQRWVSVSQITE